MKKRGKFTGDKKVGAGLLSPLENRLGNYLVPKVPRFFETYHLTNLTILWSLLIILAGYLASLDIRWLWLASLIIFFQYITDFLDGKVGKYRDTGLIKWGYYMDHFLDYIFLSSILIMYYFILPSHMHIILLMTLTIYGSFMVNSYLSFTATNKFRIHYLRLGPTEMRIVFILINILIIIFGQTYMVKALPYVFGFSLLGLIVVVYRTQRKIWKLDEKVKGKKISKF